jgi:hypothetical protein
MNSVRSIHSLGDSLSAIWRGLGRSRGLTRGAAWGLIIVGALLAFEVFNFSTTEFALRDVLGDLAFAGLPWATVLALAFCGIDFAGIARLFTPQQGRDEPAEVWYLFGAWLLAAVFNATLTWWGVSVAITRHAVSASQTLLGRGTLTTVVPVAVAVMVWLIRVLIIGTFSIGGDRLFSMAEAEAQESRRYAATHPRRPMEPVPGMTPSSLPRPAAPAFRPAPKPSVQASMAPAESAYRSLEAEPTQHDRRLQ